MKSGDCVIPGRNHPANNGILAVNPWGWEVCYWFPCPTGNLHHSPIIIARSHLLEVILLWKSLRGGSSWMTLMDAITQPSSRDSWLLKRRCCRVGHGNRYTAIYPYFFKFKASFLDPCTHHYLKKILTVGNFNQVRLIINSAVYHHHTSQNTGSHYPSNIFSSYMHIQLKSDILKKAILSFSPSTSESTNPIDSEASSDNSLT